MNEFERKIEEEIEAHLKEIEPSEVSTPLPCYAVAFDCDRPIAIGLSVVDAWNSAHAVTGSSTETLKLMGYRLIKGSWHNVKAHESSEQKGNI